MFKEPFASHSGGQGFVLLLDGGRVRTLADGYSKAVCSDRAGSRVCGEAWHETGRRHKIQVLRLS
jgi:hypothetical protein